MIQAVSACGVGWSTASTPKGAPDVRDHCDLMTGCHDESKHRAVMEGVVVSVVNGTATSTRGEHLRMIYESAAHQHNVATTLATGAGDDLCSLVIRSVRCAGTGRHR